MRFECDGYVFTSVDAFASLPRWDSSLGMIDVHRFGAALRVLGCRPRVIRLVHEDWIDVLSGLRADGVRVEVER